MNKNCQIILRFFSNNHFYIFLVKAHIRKGAALFAMREYSRAQKCYEEALLLDSNSQEAMEGLANCMRSNDEDPEKARERALQDPEVQEASDIILNGNFREKCLRFLKGKIH